MSVLPDWYRGPGLVDLQVNGYAGFDFNSDPVTWTEEAFHGVRRALLHRGVVAAFPTIITDDAPRMVARARRYAEFVDRDPELAAAFPRMHVEGPFISSEDGPRGAHPLAHCRTPEELPDLFDMIQEASGYRIGILTLAPELPGAIELIRRVSVAGVCVAIGHTAAAPGVLHRAVEAGARLSTHLGNGSHQVLPRLDNYVQRQLAEDHLFASFIADGHHMPFSTLKNFIRAKTCDRTILVTDAMMAADAGPGHYYLGDEEVVVTEDLRVSKPGQPNLAGSALTLDRAVINTCLHTGIGFAEAWAMASTQPATLTRLGALPTVTVQISTEGFQIQNNQA